MSSLSDLIQQARDRFAALPIDRAPLRRAGLLTLALVALVVGMPLLMPTRPAPADRQTLQAAPETASAAPARKSGSGGRIVALLLLAGLGAYAFALRKRTTPEDASEVSLGILESVALGPGHSLRLVACGEEILLLSVGADGARLLRNWSSAEFGRAKMAIAAPATEDEAIVAPDMTEWLSEFAEIAEQEQPEAPATGRGVLFPTSAATPPARVRQFDPAPQPETNSFASVLRQFQVADV